MTRFRVQGPDGPIAGRAVGAGPPLVLLAGLGASHRVWGELPDLLGRRFEVFAPDVRGISGSRTAAPYSLAAAGRDVIALLDRLGLGRVAVLGASLGGTVVLEAALLSPERFSRLVIASSAAHLSEHGRLLLGVLAELLGELPPAAFARALMTLAFAPPFASRYPGFVARAAETYRLSPEDAAAARGQVEHLLGGWDHRPRLPALALPTLVLAGGRDAIVAVEDTRELAASLPSAELVEIPQAGHSVLAEGGLGVLERVIAHLEGGGDRDEPPTTIRRTSPARPSDRTERSER